jgi:EAL domain-containing protein (putative c-di-GMP-specific phosphodiesterase class I)/GGDEF domain-containing protein
MSAYRLVFLSLALLMVAVTVGVCSLILHMASPQAAAEVQERQRLVTALIVRELGVAQGEPTLIPLVFAAMPFVFEDVQAQLLNAHGQVVASRGSLLSAETPFDVGQPSKLAPGRQAVTVIEGPGFWLEVSAGSARWQESIWALIRTVVLSAFGVALGAFLLVRSMAEWALSPVQRFASQLQALGERRFVFEVQPRLREWIPLSKIINVAVARVQAMLEEKQTEIEDVREELDLDSLTGAVSRHRFMMNLSRILDDDSGPRIGAVVIVHVHGLAEMNRSVGRIRADDFLRAVAVTIRSRLYRFSPRQPVLGRLNGSDFGVLLEGVEGSTLTDWLEGLAEGLKQLHTDRVSDTEYVAWIGASTYAHREAPSELLARVDAMVGDSENRREPFCITSPAQSMHFIALAQWRVLIENALDTGRVTLSYFPVVGIANEIVHYEAVLRMAAPDGTILSASAFIPPAIRTARICDLDLRAVELALVRIEQEPVSLAVNMSPHSLARPFFVKRVIEILDRAGPLARRLWIEVSELGLIDHRKDLEAFSVQVRPRGVKIGIDHFGISFSALPTLHHPLVDYVKLDQRFCVNLSHAIGQQQFVRQVVDLCTALSIKVIGQGIRRGADADAMLSMGACAVTGPAVTAALAAPELREEVDLA